MGAMHLGFAADTLPTATAASANIMKSSPNHQAPASDRQNNVRVDLLQSAHAGRAERFRSNQRYRRGSRVRAALPLACVQNSCGHSWFMSASAQHVVSHAWSSLNEAQLKIRAWPREEQQHERVEASVSHASLSGCSGGMTTRL